MFFAAERYDLTDDSVVLYFNTIDAAGVRFAIDLVQTLEQVLPQPAEIKVFDYYEPEVGTISLTTKLIFLLSSS